MKSRDFVFWLQGFFEIHGADAASQGRKAACGLSIQKVDTIKSHLALVFKHEIDPSYSADPKVQAELQAIHDGQELIQGEVEAIAAEVPKKIPSPGNSGGSGWVRPSDVQFRC